MKYGKMSKYIYGLAFVMAFLCACRGEDGSCSLSFQQLKVEKTVPLDSSEHSPACKVIIEADEINDTTRAARNMNRTIAFHLFGGMHRSFALAADSFCLTYAEQYRRDLTDLYKADRQSGINSSWYDYKYRMATEHKDGLNGYLCYLIHKVKYEGGAREYREEQCLNFDTETGELVKLEDVLPPASLALLPSLLTEELLKTYGCRNRKELQDKGILRLTDIYIPLNYELGKEGITFIYVSWMCSIIIGMLKSMSFPGKTSTICMNIMYCIPWELPNSLVSNPALRLWIWGREADFRESPSPSCSPTAISIWWTVSVRKSRFAWKWLGNSGWRM